VILIDVVEEAEDIEKESTRTPIDLMSQRDVVGKGECCI